MYLFGASGHAKVIIEILETLGVKVMGLFDDNPEIKKLLDYPVYGPYDPSNPLDDTLIISIGNNVLRKKITELYQFRYALAIHPSAMISSHAIIGTGTVIMGNAIINSGTRLGKHVIINTAASVDHDCNIGDFVHISPNATLCGGVSVGEGALIGAAAVLIPGVNIGKWATIGAGSVIITDVPDGATVVGNPGKVIKFNNIPL